MTRKTYGLIAGLIAAAGVSSWFWRSRRALSTGAEEASRGTLIFDNTPTASTADGNLNL